MSYSQKYFQEKGDLVRSIDYETVTSFDPPFVAAIKDLWNDPGIQVTFPDNISASSYSSFAGVLWQTEGVSVDRFGKIVSSLPLTSWCIGNHMNKKNLLIGSVSQRNFQPKLFNTTYWLKLSSPNLEYKNMLSL